MLPINILILSFKPYQCLKEGFVLLYIFIACVVLTTTNKRHAGPCFIFPLFHTRYGGGPPRFGGGGGGNRSGPPPGKFGNPGERLRKKHWNLDELPKFQKNFYQEHADSIRRQPVRFTSSCFSFLNRLNWCGLVSVCNHCSPIPARDWTVPK